MPWPGDPCSTAASQSTAQVREAVCARARLASPSGGCSLKVCTPRAILLCFHMVQCQQVSVPYQQRQLQAKGSKTKQIKSKRDLQMSQVKVKCALEPAACRAWMGILGARSIVSTCTALAGKGPIPAHLIAPVPELRGGFRNLPPCCLTTRRKHP